MHFRRSLICEPYPPPPILHRNPSTANLWSLKFNSQTHLLQISGASSSIAFSDSQITWRKKPGVCLWCQSQHLGGLVLLLIAHFCFRESWRLWQGFQEDWHFSRMRNWIHVAGTFNFSKEIRLPRFHIKKSCKKNLVYSSENSLSRISGFHVVPCFQKPSFKLNSPSNTKYELELDCISNTCDFACAR